MGEVCDGQCFGKGVRYPPLSSTDRRTAQAKQRTPRLNPTWSITHQSFPGNETENASYQLPIHTLDGLDPKRTNQEHSFDLSILLLPIPRLQQPIVPPPTYPLYYPYNTLEDFLFTPFLFILDAWFHSSCGHGPTH